MAEPPFHATATPRQPPAAAAPPPKAPSVTPGTHLAELWVEGHHVAQKNLHEYGIMWHWNDGQAKMMLYHHGRRVIVPWRCFLAADVPQDPWGASA
jgi:hypothetical protein